MKLIYISHPYTGNEIENKKKAARIQRKLQEADIHNCYINPLSAFEALDGMSYTTILNCCLKLLQKCDEMIVAPGWEESRGCMCECEFAMEMGMTIRFLKDSEV